MLSPEEYEKLLPHREGIMKFKETGNYSGEGMIVVDHIRQRMGYKPVCYACQGDKNEAMKDAVNLIEEYERETGINQVQNGVS